MWGHVKCYENELPEFWSWCFDWFKGLRMCPLSYPWWITSNMTDVATYLVTVYLVAGFYLPQMCLPLGFCHYHSLKFLIWYWSDKSTIMGERT